MLAYTRTFFHTLHGGKMKPSASLAASAVVILYCVHGGVADKHRGKWVEKEDPEPQKIFVSITGL